MLLVFWKPTAAPWSGLKLFPHATASGKKVLLWSENLAWEEPAVTSVGHSRDNYPSALPGLPEKTVPRREEFFRFWLRYVCVCMCVCVCVTFPRFLCSELPRLHISNHFETLTIQIRSVYTLQKTTISAGIEKSLFFSSCSLFREEKKKEGESERDSLDG